MTIHSFLGQKRACGDAREWAKQYATISEIVKNCHRGDWLLWLAQKIEIDQRPMTLAKGLCAKTVIHLMKDQRSIDAVNAAIDYGNGVISDVVLKNYAADASAAATAAYAAAAYAADAAAAYAADASDASATAAAAAAAARIKSQKQTADICREVLGQLIINKINDLI
ncbi:MAG: hypothetical protein WAT92_00365 [Saprospiraceae bacterium]